MNASSWSRPFITRRSATAEKQSEGSKYLCLFKAYSPPSHLISPLLDSAIPHSRRAPADALFLCLVQKPCLTGTLTLVGRVAKSGRIIPHLTLYNEHKGTSYVYTARLVIDSESRRKKKGRSKVQSKACKFESMSKNRAQLNSILDW